MNIKHNIQATLHKLQVCCSGSIFKPHSDSEKKSNMFATLVIQLPSKYEGGQLIVRHAGQTETVDFSSNGNNETSTFFTAFYCGCEYEVLPITDGIRVCLVYNLTSEEVPSPSASSKETISKMFKELLNKQLDSRKLIYCFDYKYSENDLCFENLKSTDYDVALLFKDLAVDCSLELMFGILVKEFHYYSNNSRRRDSHKLKNLICLDSKPPNDFDKMFVDFEEEVLPENCFECGQREEDTGNVGTNINRLACLFVFKKDNLVTVLKNAGVDNKTVRELFMAEYNRHRDKQMDDRTKAKIESWATTVASLHDGKFTLSVFEAIASLDNVSIFKTYVKRHKSNGEVMPLVLLQCQKYGWKASWKTVMLAINNIKNLTKQIEIIESLIDVEPRDDPHKIQTMHACMDYINDRRFYEYALRNEKIQQDFLSFFLLATKINYDISGPAKSKPMEAVVPVLIQIAKNSGNVDYLWLSVATHFVAEMDEISRNNPRIRNVKLPCSCTSCKFLEDFLRSGQKETKVEMTCSGHKHLRQIISDMGIYKLLACATRDSSTITLINYVAPPFAMNRHQFCVEHLPKLRDFVYFNILMSVLHWKQL